MENEIEVNVGAAVEPAVTPEVDDNENLRQVLDNLLVKLKDILAIETAREYKDVAGATVEVTSMPGLSWLVLHLNRWGNFKAKLSRKFRNRLIAEVTADVVEQTEIIYLVVIA